MKRIKPRRIPLRPDGTPMTEDDFRAIRDQITAFDDIEWTDDATRDLVERFMPDLVSRLPQKRTETSEQVFGRMKAKAKRKVAWMIVGIAARLN
ncbi:hypothetical protein [Bradyrhizobium sp. ARR65]|uniref:hypothetical protein n=1 Tax=Bradyrhizobium sp. ARR65 TaxID=1040989 RepID=UPI0004645655|nr:hypothetical protein [Bradyrhizobium sp. ARR65]